MRIPLVIALLAALTVSDVSGQEVVAEGVTPVFEEEDVIVVTGIRITREFPVEYVPRDPLFPESFTTEVEGGRTVFTYRRELLDLGDGASLEFYRRWSDGDGYDHEAVPERRETRGRLVFRF